jgi:hypothetical protein
VAIFLLGEGENFIMFFIDRPTNKKQNKISKHAPIINYYGSQEDMIINGI